MQFIEHIKTRRGELTPLPKDHQVVDFDIIAEELIICYITTIPEERSLAVFWYPETSDTTIPDGYTFIAARDGQLLFQRR